MKIYLVGGAVREKLLGNRPEKDRDWVVIGSTIEEMINLGFKPVGKEFPVFLHPETREEYALARSEKKIAKGYRGFEFYTDPSITIEEDLIRRDLTINAIAIDEYGNITDPYNGQIDLKNKVLRHVSNAFSEDPVRALRLARFSSQFPDFSVAEETKKLVKTMGESGELNALVPERIWLELKRGLSEKAPWKMFEVLRDCDVLKYIFPEIDSLFGIPNPEKFHPEIDTGIHTMLSLKQATLLSENPAVRFSVLCHDFGKATTPKEILPRHFGHSERGIAIVKNFCERLKTPHEYSDLALLVTHYHSIVHTALTLKHTTLLRLLKSLDAFRRPNRFKDFLLACLADARGKTGYENDPYPQKDFLMKAYEITSKIDIQKVIHGLSQEKIPEAIDFERLAALKCLLS